MFRIFTIIALFAIPISDAFKRAAPPSPRTRFLVSTPRHRQTALNYFPNQDETIFLNECDLTDLQRTVSYSFTTAPDPTEQDEDSETQTIISVPLHPAQNTIQSVISHELSFFAFLFNLVTLSAVFGAITRSGVFSNFMSGPRGGGAGKKGAAGSKKGRGQNFFNFPGASESTDLYTIQEQNVTRNEWAGSPEVFQECADVIDFFAYNQQNLFNIKFPRGYLLEGPPGCGKTKLAKIIATEAGVNFIAVSGSDFVELFVGNGALKVRKLFDFARENRPCIIFIDEIDAMAKKRGANAFGSNDEREQTLNQLLFEMDGFHDNDDIIVLAATNRKDVLDDAILRPGRFDRHIYVPHPDTPSRRKILDLYLSEKPCAADISINDFVETTAGMSGADLKNLVNEAAILSLKRGGTEIENADLTNALDKLILGILKKEDNRTPEMLRRIAIHELGHAIMVALSDKYFVLDKISIQNSYSGMEGYTLYRERYPENLSTKELLRRKINILFGGYIAEKLFYGEENVSIGSSHDIKQANELAKSMLNIFGFGKSFLSGGGGGGAAAPPYQEISDITRAKRETEVAQLLKECFQETEETLKKYTGFYFENYINKLITRKTIPGDLFSEFIAARGLPPSQ